MKKLLCLALLAITGCTRTIEHDRPVTVKVPVAQPCAGERPARPAALKDTMPDWNTLDVRQKAAVVARQGLSWQTYGEQLDAATAACP